VINVKLFHCILFFYTFSYKDLGFKTNICKKEWIQRFQVRIGVCIRENHQRTINNHDNAEVYNGSLLILMLLFWCIVRREMMLPAPSTTMVMILIKCTLRTSFQCSSLLYRFKLLVSVIVYTFLEMSWSIPIDAPSQLSSAGLWFNLKHIFTPEITENN